MYSFSMRALLLAAGLVAALAPLPAMAGELERDKDTVETVEREGKVAHDLGLVLLPIPRSDPTLGSGLSVPALFLYNPEGSKGRPWMTGAGAMYTDSHSWGAGLFQKAYLFDDQLRLTGALAYADLNLDFYGVGANAGKQGISVPIEQSGSFLFLEGLGQIARSTFLGLRYQRIDLETGIGALVPPVGGVIPAAQLDSTSAMMGPVFQYDTRDSEQNPKHGSYVNFSWMFARDAMGSDSNYEKAQLRASHYLPLDSSSVLAVRASLCSAEGQAPFYDICLFGSNNDLRGYVGGQYRDKALFAIQAEYRWRFAERWGMVAFGGVGGVAKSLGSFSGNDTLPSIGAGLRFLASQKYGVNVSMDYAIGRDTKAFYFYIGEAF